METVTLPSKTTGVVRELRRTKKYGTRENLRLVHEILQWPGNPVFLKNGVRLEMRNRNHALTKAKQMPRASSTGAERGAGDKAYRGCLWEFSGPLMRSTRGHGVIPCSVLTGKPCVGSWDVNGRTMSSQVVPVQTEGPLPPDYWLEAWPIHVLFKELLSLRLLHGIYPEDPQEPG